jgi:hypothetical protein
VTEEIPDKNAKGIGKIADVALEKPIILWQIIFSIPTLRGRLERQAIRCLY